MKKNKNEELWQLHQDIGAVLDSRYVSEEQTGILPEAGSALIF